MLDPNFLQFIEESNEHLANIENDLIMLENISNDIDMDIVNKIFRAIHTIKGSSGFFDLKVIKKLSHKAENVLDLIRQHKLIPDSFVINTLLDVCDKLQILISRGLDSNQDDVSELIEKLNEILKTSIVDSTIINSIDKMVDIKDSNNKVVISINEYDFLNSQEMGMYIYLIQADLIHDVQLKGRDPLSLHRDMLGTGTLEEFFIDFDAVGTLEDDDFTNKLPIIIVFSTKIKPHKIWKLFELKEDNITIVYNPENSDKQISDVPNLSIDNTPSDRQIIEKVNITTIGKVNSLKVKVELLENLMSLAGELVIMRNELNNAIDSKDYEKLKASGLKISTVTSDIQEAIMQTRLQEIGILFNKFPRIVRELGKNLDKKIGVTITGSEVDLDKSLIDGLSDPLIHMVRNSADHGIETPATRLEKGKPEEGEIQLKAYHEAGKVIIEVSDDGAGIDSEVIVNKAIENGLININTAAKLTEREKLNLIFTPGLSTAKTLTDVSGRGVGMDVVKSKIDELGGSIDITSVLDTGTTFKVKLPLTLAIIRSLIVFIGNERLIIPQATISEIISIKRSEVINKSTKSQRNTVLNLRGKVISIINLENLLEIGKIEHKKDVYIVIVSSEIYHYGIIVSDLGEIIETVVKPLGRLMNRRKEYSGATILGDGKVALILDITGIAQICGIIE